MPYLTNRLAQNAPTPGRGYTIQRAEAAAPTLADLARRFREEHLPRKRSRRDDESLLENDIVPRLGRKKVAELRHADIEALHREVTKRAPIRANRAVAVMSKMLSMAVRWEWCAANVARGIEKNPEQPRHTLFE